MTTLIFFNVFLLTPHPEPLLIVTCSTSPPIPTPCTICALPGWGCQWMPDRTVPKTAGHRQGGILGSYILRQPPLCPGEDRAAQQFRGLIRVTVAPCLLPPLILPPRLCQHPEFCRYPGHGGARSGLSSIPGRSGFCI